MTDGLEKLFGSPARVKLLRLFLFNPRQSFTLQESALRTRISDADIRREIALLLRAGVIERAARGKGVRFGLRSKFEYVTSLQNLLLNAPTRGRDIVERMRGLGSIKLIILSGVFVGEWENRIDIFIVGDKIQERKLRDRVRGLEAEIGKEIRFALLGSDEFLYRLNMSDKLVRDVLDYPHTVVLDKLNIGLK